MWDSTDSSLAAWPLTANYGRGVFCVDGLLQPVLLRVPLAVMKHIRFEDVVSLRKQSRSPCHSVGGEKASWMSAAEKCCLGGSEVEFGFCCRKEGFVLPPTQPQKRHFCPLSPSEPSTYDGGLCVSHSESSCSPVVVPGGDSTRVDGTVPAVRGTMWNVTCNRLAKGCLIRPVRSR